MIQILQLLNHHNIKTYNLDLSCFVAPSIDTFNIGAIAEVLLVKMLLYKWVSDYNEVNPADQPFQTAVSIFVIVLQHDSLVLFVGTGGTSPRFFNKLHSIAILRKNYIEV